jgi:uncharacterized protein
MNELETFPYQVRCLENIYIPVAPNVRLAARIWLPDTEEPVPAVLEYLPYRKRDRTRVRDSVNGPYMAGHGYAYVRVDIRGCGDSEGLILDQYTEEELEDGVQVIDWLSRRQWCNGKVGMMGISWGGFNALQVAARQPEALGAIITVCSTDNTYIDNMHYMGGCLLSDNLSEATTMFGYQSLPPDPEIVGDRWREMWLERLENCYQWLEPWLEHQHKDDYWKRTSVDEDYGAIRCPVLAASGWADGFSNSVFRLMEHLDVPRKAFVGPWRHLWPHQGEPGPAIGFLQIALAWFDRHLSYSSGLSDQIKPLPESALTVWMQDSVSPQFAAHKERPGRWVGLTSWPSAAVDTLSLSLSPSTLWLDGRRGHPDTVQQIRSPLTVGLYAGKWCSYAGAPDMPGDQREEDGGSLVYETEPLQESVEIVGTPVVELEVSADQPIAQVAVRLSDVLPDGSAHRVSFGVCNLTHRESHDNPAPLIPGDPVRVQIALNALAQKFPVGNRIRLSISSSYWPLIWPTPRPATLTVYPGRSSLLLPVLSSETGVRTETFPEPEGAKPIPYTVIKKPEVSWRAIRDFQDNRSTLEVVRQDSVKRLDDIDLEMAEYTLELYSSERNDPSTVRGETVTRREFCRDDWHSKVETRTILTSDKERFYLHATLDAFEGDKRTFSRTWNRRIDRRFV